MACQAEAVGESAADALPGDASGGREFTAVQSEDFEPTGAVAVGP